MTDLRTLLVDRYRLLTATLLTTTTMTNDIFQPGETCGSDDDNDDLHYVDRRCCGPAVAHAPSPLGVAHSWPLVGI